jgi:hypothetical protein
MVEIQWRPRGRHAGGRGGSGQIHSLEFKLDRPKNHTNHLVGTQKISISG